MDLTSRRAVLRSTGVAVAVGLTGCSDGGTGGDGTTTAGDSEPTTTDDGEPTMTPGSTQASADTVRANCDSPTTLTRSDVVDGATLEAPFFRKIAGQDADVLLLVNKVDIHSPAEIAKTLEAYEEEGIFEEYIPISALTGDGVDAALQVIINYLPEGERLFPRDMVTDKPLDFLISELVREKIYKLTYEELPYSVATRTRSYKRRESEDLFEAYVDIYVVRNSQKGIIIGEKGKKIKQIGRRAREDLEKLVGSKVYLDLKVKVSKNWNRKTETVESLTGFENE